MSIKPKYLFIFLGALLCGLGAPITYKMLPVVRAKESYRTSFPAHQFHQIQKQAIPTWVHKQIECDFQEFTNRPITIAMLDQTHHHLCQIGRIEDFVRYRILDNRLYKWVPDEKSFSNTDTSFEKAFKTLLLYTEIPDVDFLLCTMDGIPEPYMPPGFFLLPDPEKQAPILAQAKRKTPLTNTIILIPDQFSLHANWTQLSKEVGSLNDQIHWVEKQEKAVWRGGLTDTGTRNEQPLPTFNPCPRFTICKQSLQIPSLIDAGITWAGSSLKPLLQRENVFKAALDTKGHLYYKYLPVLDGHMCTYPGYQWRLLSNSLCLKQESDQIQWFYGALKPYTHYVPIQTDLSDLEDKLQWALSHDQEAFTITQNATEFATHHLLSEHNYLYLYLVLNKLASMEQIHFASLKQATKKDPQWKCIQYRKRLSLNKSWTRLLEKIKIETHIQPRRPI